MEINKLTLKALLLDTIVFLKTGKHLAPNYKQAKNTLCDMIQQNRNINSKHLLKCIGIIYAENGCKDEFLKVVHNHKATEFIN